MTFGKPTEGAKGVSLFAIFGKIGIMADSEGFFGVETSPPLGGGGDLSEIS